MLQTFSIEQLGHHVAEALQRSDYQPPPSGRIRAVPDTRTIRYYTTLGLIDRPAAMDGRTALYDQRHVDQIVAIKRMQADGLSLSDIQNRVLSVAASDTDTDADIAPPDRLPSRPPDRSSPTPAMSVRLSREIQLAPGVRLVLDLPGDGRLPPDTPPGKSPAPTPIDTARLSAAAWSLIAELQHQGLVDSPSATAPSDPPPNPSSPV